MTDITVKRNNLQLTKRQMALGLKVFLFHLRSSLFTLRANVYLYVCIYYAFIYVHEFMNTCFVYIFLFCIYVNLCVYKCERMGVCLYQLMHTPSLLLLIPEYVSEDIYI